MKIPINKENYNSAEDWEEFERGVSYFNNGEYEHSFEAWELLWERKDLHDKKFLRGLMELATGCHDIAKHQDFSSAENNLDKAQSKLEKFLPEYFSVPVEPLLDFINDFKTIHAGRNHNGKRGSQVALPQIEFYKPDNPDLLVEICEALESQQFREGAKLFNSGLFWEAHEAWQELWREQVGEGKIFIEAFVHLAEAYSFIKLGKAGTAIYLFEKSIKRFKGYERVRCSVSITSLITDVKNTLMNLHQSPGNGKIHIKPAEIKFVGQTVKNN